MQYCHAKYRNTMLSRFFFFFTPPPIRHGCIPPLQLKLTPCLAYIICISHLFLCCGLLPAVIATNTHTTVVTTAPQHYPQQPTAAPAQPQSYQGGQYQPTYHPVPVQPGYGAQPVPQAYGAQAMPQSYGAQPMPQAYGAQPMPTSSYHGQQFTAGPPPTYQGSQWVWIFYNLDKELQVGLYNFPL